MRFTVNWSRTAFYRLAKLWNESRDKAAFTLAADSIERLLASNPLDHAHRLSAKHYELEVWPLVVVFSVDVNDRKVLVEEVKELGPLYP